MQSKYPGAVYGVVLFKIRKYSFNIQVLFMYDWHIIVGWEGNPIKGSQLQGKLEVVTCT